MAAPAVRQQTRSSRADNTKRNKDNGPSADQQKMNSADRAITQKIRKAIHDDKAPTYGAQHQDRHTGWQSDTSRPVRSDDEKSNLQAKAVDVAGQDNVQSTGNCTAEITQIELGFQIKGEIECQVKVAVFGIYSTRAPSKTPRFTCERGFRRQDISVLLPESLAGRRKWEPKRQRKRPKGGAGVTRRRYRRHARSAGRWAVGDSWSRTFIAAVRSWPALRGWRRGAVGESLGVIGWASGVRSQRYEGRRQKGRIFFP